MWASLIWTVVALISSSCLVSGQAYGSSSDERDPVSKFPQGQQTVSLPQYESSENLWWHNKQNSFQQPPGHPGVEISEPKVPASQKPQEEAAYSRNPNSYNSPVANNVGAPSTAASQNINRHRPGPPQYGLDDREWNEPGCDLVNKADCHNAYKPPSPPPQNYQPPPPPQNYQPPPVNTQTTQNQYRPVTPQQAASVKPPSQSYNPPPPPPSTTTKPTSNRYSPPTQAPRPTQPFHRPSTPPQQKPVQPSFHQTFRPPQVPRPLPNQQQVQNAAQGVRPNGGTPPQIHQHLPYPGCPAAMLCVQDDFCNMIGLIEDSPVQLSEAAKLHRVALMQCSEPMTGIVGVCCRDPNYKDPWPDMGSGKKDGVMMMKKLQGQGGGQSFFGSQQKLPFSSQSPPQGNHLASGIPTPAGVVTVEREENRGSKAIIFNTASADQPSESKQAVQVLEPCSGEELCVSLAQCNSLNPQFMAKTGLITGKVNSSEVIKVKRCKYERSGIQYLCCSKPEDRRTTARPFFQANTSFSRPINFPTSRPATRPIVFTTVSRPVFTTTAKPPTTFPGSAFPSVFTFSPSISPTSSSTLVSGLGLRFHSHLHTQQQKEVNANKPNPYGPDEEPIRLVSSPIITPPPTFSNFAPPVSHTFKFTPTTPPPLPPQPPTAQLPQGTRFPTREPFSNTFPTSTTPLQPISTFARVLVTTTLPHNNSTLILPPTPPPQIVSTSIKVTTPTTADTIPSSTPPSTSISSTTKRLPFRVESQFETNPDFSLIPTRVPLRKELVDEPPIGFIFKGDDLYVPELQVPSQNYIVPAFDFEARTLPTEETPSTPQQQEEEVEVTTTIFRVADEPFHAGLTTQAQAFG